MQRLQDNVAVANLVAPVRGDPVGTEQYAFMGNFASANVAVRVNVGTSDSQSILTLKQATDAAGTGEKALTFTRATKVTDMDVTNVPALLTGLSSSIRVGVTAGDQLYQINVVDTDLDVDNDFTHFRIDLSTSAADTVFEAHAGMYHARYTGGPDKFPQSS